MSKTSDPTRPRSSFVPPDPSELAARFPHLEILEIIGQGGMGVVYQARQIKLDRLVALKILTPDAARGPGFEERFTREARALARVSHPNIVAISPPSKRPCFPKRRSDQTPTHHCRRV